MNQKSSTKIKPRKLNVLQNEVVDGATCFSIHKQYNVACQRTKCFHWHENSQHNNCILIAAQDGSKTLQEVGDVFKLSRMRICQIEKSIREKLNIID